MVETVKKGGKRELMKVLDENVVLCRQLVFKLKILMFFCALSVCHFLLFLRLKPYTFCQECASV